MESNKASTTAWAVAMARAAHAKYHAPPIFDDSLVLSLIDPQFQPMLEYFAPPEQADATYNNRAYIAFRQRYQEQCLADSYASGVRQYVILGAGLDSYAFRQSAQLPQLQIFEVDFPATQQQKRERIAALGWDWPANLVFAPCDFNRDDLLDALVNSGFDPMQPAYFAWMGVTVYLPKSTVEETLARLLQLSPTGSCIAMEYAPLTQSLTGDELVCREASLAQPTRDDEPFLAFYSEAEMRELLTGLGYTRVTPLDHDAAAREVLAHRSDSIGIHYGFRLLCAYW